MAAPMMDPNAAGPAPGDGFDGLFEELVEDSVEEHAAVFKERLQLAGVPRTQTRIFTLRW